jgi:hypothetical protein
VQRTQQQTSIHVLARTGLFLETKSHSAIFSRVGVGDHRATAASNSLPSRCVHARRSSATIMMTTQMKKKTWGGGTTTSNDPTSLEPKTSSIIRKKKNSLSSSTTVCVWTTSKSQEHTHTHTHPVVGATIPVKTAAAVSRLGIL